MSYCRKKRDFFLTSIILALTTLFFAIACKPVRNDSSLNEFTESERARYTLLLADLEKNPRCYNEENNPLSLFTPAEIEQETVDYDLFESAILPAEDAPCDSVTEDNSSDTLSPKELLRDGPDNRLNLNYVGAFNSSIKILRIGAKQAKLILRGKIGGIPFKTSLGVRSAKTALEIQLPTFIKEALKQPIALNPHYLGENSPGNVFGWLVKYLSPQELRAYKITIRNGKFYAANGKLFSTSAASTTHSDDARAIFVVNKDGNIYASLVQTVGRFHHSSMTAGGDVLTAGEIAVDNGKLVLISNKSGHYRPSKDSIKTLLSTFEKVGVDVSNVKEDFW